MKLTLKMIIRIKKRDLIVLLVLLSIVPVVYAAVVTQTFMVTVTMGNRGPSIFYVNVSNVTPTAGTTTTISIEFNVSDEDGFANLNDSTANVNIYYNGVWRNSSSCTANDYNTNFSRYVCSITFYYYDNATGGWQINASIKDNSGNATHNSTWNLTISSLSAIGVKNNLTFTSVNLGQDNVAPDSDFVLNNTGNFDFTEVNITGYDLVGMSDSSYSIGVGNFTVNVTDTGGPGETLVNKTAVNIPTATLPHKAGDTDLTGANESLYFWLDVPSSSEITVQNYNSTTLWIATVE